ncbi:hypothetical protein Brsp05_03026 [Brucella sp. NBRC 12953]|uniref:vWA domain-containing protein n=1 Tax=Brucella sp. NBRC 12953 TaxID=3075481 RepID=UPI0030964E4E
MVDLLEGAKRKIWSIANTIVDVQPDADIRMALIGYRDRGDDYVVKSFDMSKDLQSLYANLRRFEADGGGDDPESVNEALDNAIGRLTWSEGSATQRIVFLVGDAPPHMDYKGERKYPEILAEAKSRNIRVNAVQAGNSEETRNFWKDIAERGSGRYIQIAQDGGRIDEVKTPYDQEIITVQQNIDNTIMPYGNAAIRQELNSKLAAKAAAPMEAQVENSKFYSKRSSMKEVVTGGGDLLDDIRNKNLKWDEVKESELPALLKDKSHAEQKKIIDETLNVRTELERQMTDLVQKRDEYVESEMQKNAKNGDVSFDKVVADMLKQQLAQQ